MPDDTHEPHEPRRRDSADEVFDLTPDDQEPALDDLSAEEALDALEFAAGEGAQADALRREKDELEAKLLRTAADYQNYVRRSAREIEATRQQRVVDIARSLVAVLDHFDRALDVDPEKTTPAELLQGVGTIREELLKSLGQFGFRRVQVEPGTEFDPNHHEALMHQPHEDFAAGQVVQQFQPGYVVNDTPVRPAQVSVASE